MDLIGLANYAVFVAILMGIYALLALGLNIQWGFSGLFNAGIAGFFAIGAYTSAILTSPTVAGRVGGFDLPIVIGWVGAMAMAGLIAWPIGRVCLRFRSDYLAIATIGVAEIIRLVIRTEDWLTGGPRGIIAIPRPFGDLAYMPSQLAFLALVVVLVALAYALIERQLRAPWGRMMRAIRDNELAAAAMGKHIEARRHHRCQPGVTANGIHQVEDGKRTAGRQRVQPLQVTFEPDDLGPIAERIERAGHGFRRQDGVDLVRTRARGRMDDGNEASCRGCHHAVRGRRSPLGRQSPARASP